MAEYPIRVATVRRGGAVHLSWSTGVLFCRGAKRSTLAETVCLVPGDGRGEMALREILNEEVEPGRLCECCWPARFRRIYANRYQLRTTEGYR